MSMQNYAEYGFGLIFTGHDIDGFVHLQGYEDVFDFVEACEEKRHDARFYNEEMDGRSACFLNGDSEEYEDMLCIWAYNQPDAFERAYLDEFSVAEEMKTEFSFPADFCWRDHLGYFSCCVYA